MSQFDSTLEVIYQRMELLKVHKMRCGQAAKLLEEGLRKSPVRIELEISSHRKGFVGTVRAYISVETSGLETEILALEEIRLKDPRGVTQIVESVLNKISDNIKTYL